MGARVDSDDDGGDKTISKKETRMLLAINSAEPILIDAMTQEMLNDDRLFDVEKFVEVFRKYTPHFVQMLIAESSDDSDEEDEHSIPQRYLPFLNAFAKARDGFVAAIKINYKALCKKDLKDINFSVFSSHPEEIFKRYVKCSGRQTLPSCASHRLQSTTQSLNSSVRTEGDMDYVFNTININDSVDTDHGSLLSGQEEELRKTIESESDTPTPTIEDWNGVKERRKSMERTNDLNRTRCTVPDAVPLMVPPTGLMPEYCQPNELPTSPNMGLIKREGSPLGGMVEKSSNSQAKAQETDRNATPIHSSNTSQGSTAQSYGFQPILSMSSNANNNIVSESSNNIPHNSAAATRSSSLGKETKREDGDYEEEVMDMMDILRDAMNNVHQDVRFALPPMIERVVRANIKEKRPITITELIGEDYADDRLEKFIVKMLSKDNFLMMMLELKFNSRGESMVDLRPSMLNQLKDHKNSKVRGRGEQEERVAEIALSPNIESISPFLLDSLNHCQFFPQASNLPMPPLTNGRNDVSMPYAGSFAVVLSKWAPVVDAQLEGLRQLEIDHLNLSSERHLEKGRAVVLKSDVGSYCRGIIYEDWTRDSKDGKASEVKCWLIDYGEEHYIPIEAIYAFPKWTETIPPALILIAKLKAYPREATLETDMFSQSDWLDIAQVLHEWKTSDFNIHVLSCEGDKYVIDLENDVGESFTDVLVKRGIVKKELHFPAVSSPPSLSCSSDEHSHSIDPVSLHLTSEGGIPVEQTLDGASSSPTPPIDINDGCISIELPPQVNRQMDEPTFGTRSCDLPCDEQIFPTKEKKIERCINSDDVEEKTTELARSEGNWADVMGSGCRDTAPTIRSLNVISGAAMTSPASSLVVRSEEPKIRDFLEVPPSTGIPSVLQFIAQPAVLIPPPVIGFPIRRTGLVQILDDDE